MRQDDLSELRAVLREAVVACRRSNRDLEDDLGLGHGSLQRMLDGRIDIRVHHLVEIARILQVHPMEFLELGFPDWPARHHLSEWMKPDLRKRATKRPGLPATREELSELVRGIVREEIDAREPGQPRKP
ncbi:MAG TPA: hypothetical protein VNW71_14145 [Thermoanaerobaculia bacterium]|nr:hypothetical protein [Thermoanaerobaculia bacterium]